MKEQVAAAMADKYWMDILIRHESHPMVARLWFQRPPHPRPHRIEQDARFRDGIRCRPPR